MLLIIVVFGKLFLQCRKLNIRLIPQSLNRGKAVPGGVCGFWGACGVGISAGVFISIISGATPLKNEPWGLANKMTSKALDAIGSIGGPRCCKRDSYMAIILSLIHI